PALDLPPPIRGHRLPRRLHDVLDVRGGDGPAGQGRRRGPGLRLPRGQPRRRPGCGGGRHGPRPTPRPPPRRAEAVSPLAWVAFVLAGAVGAPARYLVDGWVQDRTPADGFPWGVFVVNLT